MKREDRLTELRDSKLTAIIVFDVIHIKYHIREKSPDFSAKLKSVFFKKVLGKINSSKNMQKRPHQFAAVWEGRFCIFLDELILSSTFLKKTDFSKDQTTCTNIYQSNSILTHISIISFEDDKTTTTVLNRKNSDIS